MKLSLTVSSKEVEGPVVRAAATAVGMSGVAATLSSVGCESVFWECWAAICRLEGLILSDAFDDCDDSAAWLGWLFCGAPLTLKRCALGSRSVPNCMHCGTYGSNLTNITLLCNGISRA
jgi:hypothetical protein